MLDGRVRTRFLNKDDTPPADATESRHNLPAGTSTGTSASTSA
ncbi:hypothetical protein ACFWB2_33685 [Streptomyces virginiae]